MQGLDALLALEQIGRDAEALVSLEAIAHEVTLDQAHHRERSTGLYCSLHYHRAKTWRIGR
jgi:hypothetical protein